jgi:hypothetical protein
MAKLAGGSPAALAAVVQREALKPLFDAVMSDDVLLKLSAIQLISGVTRQLGGYSLLVRHATLRDVT